MGRRKNEKENIRNIQRSKNSYYVTIPIELMREMKWRERQKVVVKKTGRNKIIISDWKR